MGFPIINGTSTVGKNEMTACYPYVFGDGQDGAFSASSGNTNLTSRRLYQYTSFALTGTATLTGAAGAVFVILVQGDATISSSGTSVNCAGTVGGGGAGGAAGSGSGSSGNSFYTSPLFLSSTFNQSLASMTNYYQIIGGTGAGWSTSGGGGGGGWGTGATAGSGGSAGAAGSKQGLFHPSSPLNILFLPGCGGGGGSGDGANAGGAGGGGGGFFALIVGGNLTFSGTVSVAGGNGGNSGGGTAGAGGGGGGGMCIMLCQGTLVNSGTVTVTAGVSGTGGTAGGAGSTGDSHIGLFI